LLAILLTAVTSDKSWGRPTRFAVEPLPDGKTCDGNLFDTGSDALRWLANLMDGAEIALEVGAMSFLLYLIGTVIVIIGLVYGAHLAHVPTHWIVVFAIVTAGLGILGGVKSTRMKDPPSN
jgi:hypothetical protein